MGRLRWEDGTSSKQLALCRPEEDCDGKMALPVSSWLTAGLRKTVMGRWKDGTFSKELAHCRHEGVFL